jgi:hypothetical protein
MNILSFIKSLFAKRDEHVKSVEKIDKQIEEALYKIEPQEVKPKNKAKKKPVKKKINGSK